MGSETRGIVGDAADRASAAGRRTIDAMSNAAGVVAEKATSSGIAAGETISAAAVKVSDAASSAAGAVAVAAGKAVELSSTIAGKASEVALSGATIVGDLNGDGKLDEADLQIARDATAQVATAIGAEAADLSKSVMKSDMVKQAAAGAAIGAVVAIPLPVIGPAIGATIGAALGVWRSFTNSDNVSPMREAAPPKDALAEIDKLYEMKERGVITEADFERQKQKLLR